MREAKHMMIRVQFTDYKTGRLVWHTAPIMYMQEAIDRYNMDLDNLTHLGIYNEEREVVWYKPTKENMKKILRKAAD